MKIKDIFSDWIIMPQSIKPMGLIHKPGKGPNYRFDYKNKGNNKANEEAAGVGIVTKQNATADVPVGGQYMNVKKLGLGKSKPKSYFEDKQITHMDLKQLEKYADKLFASLNIDVAFSKHFLDRVNDERNKKQITMAELTRIFKQVYRQHGKPISKLGPDAEAVMKDMKTDVNIPFAIQWDGKEFDLVAKTVMRKQNFTTPNKEFTVENFADGKVKGKSRPGRVKKSGASCKGSISSLRSKAKKYGGEKGKMYHWCANMKSGRKNKK